MGSTVDPNALGTAVGVGTVEKEFVRQYFDNGLAVYDVAGTRFGIVADYDRPGGGFVVQLADRLGGLYIPMRLVRKVRRGKVYLSELARDLASRPPGPVSQLRQPRPLLNRVLRVLASCVRIDRASE